MSTLRPLHDRVLIKRLEGATQTPGGIIIPEKAKEKPQEGEVVAVGIGRVLDDGSIVPLAVEVGNKVLFQKYVTEIEINGEECLILREDELLAVIDE